MTRTKDMAIAVLIRRATDAAIRLQVDAANANDGDNWNLEAACLESAIRELCKHGYCKHCGHTTDDNGACSECIATAERTEDLF